jgi:MscS family membrane protein
LGIEYKHCAKEIDAFCNKLRSLINSYKEVDKTDVRVNFVNYSDSSLDIEVFFYADIVPLAEFFDFKTKFNCDVKALAESMNIDFAFDSRSLYFANELKIKNNEK